MGLSDAIKASVELAQRHTEAKKRAEVNKFDTDTGERTRWGERIGYEGAGTADFIDSDRDRVDDRYQVGPGGKENKKPAKARDEAYILPWEREGWGSGDYDRKINRETRRPALRTGVFHPTTGLQRDYAYMPTEKEQRRERAYEEIGAPEIKRDRIRDPAIERPKEYDRWQGDTGSPLPGNDVTIQPFPLPEPPPRPIRQQLENWGPGGRPPQFYSTTFESDKDFSKGRKPNVKSSGNQGPPPPPQAPKWDERPAYIAPWDRDDWGRDDNRRYESTPNVKGYTPQTQIEPPKKYGRWQDAVLEGYTPSRPNPRYPDPRPRGNTPKVSDWPSLGKGDELPRNPGGTVWINNETGKPWTQKGPWDSPPGKKRGPTDGLIPWKADPRLENWTQQPSRDVY